MTEQENGQQPLYSMKVVCQLTGLRPDTLRAWERRYGAVTPQRSDGQTRRYSPNEVRRLKLLRDATQQGHSIGSIAALSETRLRDLVGERDSQSKEEGSLSGIAPAMLAGDWIEEYLRAVHRLDATRARNLLGRAAAYMEPTDFVFSLAIPILREVGDRWACKRLGVAHEHLVSHQMRGVFDHWLASAYVRPGAPKLIAVTPPGHLHEFGVLLGSMLAVLRGWGVIYLGTDLPYEDLEQAVKTSNCDVLMMGISRKTDKQESDLLSHFLTGISSDCQVWMGIDPRHNLLEILNGVRTFHSFEDLDIALEEKPK